MSCDYCYRYMAKIIATFNHAESSLSPALILTQPNRKRGREATHIIYYTKITFVRLSVCVSVTETLPNLTGNRVDPEAFSPSHSGLEAAGETLWKVAT